MFISSPWLYTHDANGMRIGRSNGTKTYSYLYTNGLLSRMILGDDTLCFAYDAVGAPLTVNYNGTTFYYVTNLQGDVIAILDRTGYPVVQYTYNAWGELLSATGPMLSSLGALNPLLYRGYVYDRETGLYYLQSRYYNPEIGRFISADSYASTGQGILGNNMFVYCINNPVNGCDPCGTCFHRWDFWNDCDSCGGRTLGDKCNDFLDWVGDLDVATTRGYYLSANTGIWSFTGSLELAMDSEFNIQLNGSLSFEVSTAGEPSVSAGRTSSLFFVPNVSYLEGGTDFLGGSATVPIPKTPIAVAGGLNVGRTSDGYWGGALSAGVTPATRFGKEFHGGHAETWRLSPRINLRSLLFG